MPSSDAVDTDFVAKLVDVHPDGSSYNMAEGIVRAALPRQPEQASLLKPGQVYRFEIDLVGTSIAFQKGHRIRVHVTSSHFPQFDRNPNTGAAFGTTAKVKVAQQTIYHDAERAVACRAAGDSTTALMKGPSHTASEFVGSLVSSGRRCAWLRFHGVSSSGTQAAIWPSPVWWCPA